MPLYEYECMHCKVINEVQAKISDPAPKTCPQCGKGPLTKVISKTSFVLKGGGWYVSDYKPSTKKDSSAIDSKETTPAKETPAAPTSESTTPASPATPAKSTS